MTWNFTEVEPNNKLSLVKVMAWCLSSTKPLPELMIKMIDAVYFTSGAWCLSGAKPLSKPVMLMIYELYLNQ